MGYQTSYLGRLDIEPPLNDAEVEWLTAFHHTSRDLHPHDPYEVPMHPRAERSEVDGIGPSPDLHAAALRFCDWGPTPNGMCLRWHEADKSNGALRELSYLIEHFLRPGARASTDGRADFEEFTFDHVVSGVIAAERSDGRLTLLVAEDNELREMVLVPGADPW